MHVYVEAPMIALGKRMGGAWFGSRKRDKHRLSADPPCRASLDPAKTPGSQKDAAAPLLLFRNEAASA
jgi:hypothetical protein